MGSLIIVSEALIAVTARGNLCSFAREDHAYLGMVRPGGPAVPGIQSDCRLRTVAHLCALKVDKVTEWTDTVSECSQEFEAK